MLFKTVPVSGSNLYSLVKILININFSITTKQQSMYSQLVLNLLNNLLKKNPKKEFVGNNFLIISGFKMKLKMLMKKMKLII